MHDVAEYGWHVVMVNSERSPDWAYSIGLWHTYRSSELAVAGLPLDNAMTLINQIGDRIKAGVSLKDGDRLDDLLTSDLDVACRTIDEGWYRPLFGQAIDFSMAPPLPFLQVVWPDRAGRFPWEEGFDLTFAQSQPQLHIPPKDHPMGRWSSLLAPDPWPYPDPHDTPVFATRRITDDGGPVLAVHHDLDGSWQFVDNGPKETEDIALVHLGHIVGADPTVVELADLPIGWMAFRASPMEAWTRRAVKGRATRAAHSLARSLRSISSRS
jgi:hypothetical protein